MGKLGKQTAKLEVVRNNKKAGLIRTTGATETNPNGGTGFLRGAKSELFLLGVTNMVSEDTFYEKGSDRDTRYRELIRTVTLDDPDWVARFLPWLRGTANMRTASIVGAAEYARAAAQWDAETRDGFYATYPHARVRNVVASVLQRPDEVGEFVAYWTRETGNGTLPGGVQRGLQDAINKHFTQKNSLKYDGANQPKRMGDLIQIVHPKPLAVKQALLWAYLVDKRINGNDAVIPDGLDMLTRNRELWEMDQAERREFLGSSDIAAILRMAGMTWESLSTWLGSPLGKEGWEAIVPSMGIFALVRNIRNISEAGVSNEVQEMVAKTISDPEIVASSRMFPLRFYTAFREVSNVIWHYPLEKALNASLANVPKLKGRTLVLVDQSGSMDASISQHSTVKRSEAAALFGAALGMAAEKADVYAYGGGWAYLGRSTNHVRMVLPKGGSLLPVVAKYGRADLGGTQTWTTLRELYSGHDRVVIVTDEQTSDRPNDLPDVPIVTFNVAGYKHGHVDSSTKRITVGGLSDGGFTLIQAMDSRGNGDWPF